MIIPVGANVLETRQGPNAARLVEENTERRS
jgi:hypothetical protein